MLRMSEARVAAGARWSRDDWVELAAARLKVDGAAGLTVDALCVVAGRTKGSFYHHFETVEALLVELARRWRRTETDEIGALAVAEADPRRGLRALARRSERMDHSLEIGVRTLAAQRPEVAALVQEADSTREGIIADLLARAYGLAAAEAADVARIFHSLQLAAQLRTPHDVAGFSAGPARRLTAWLEAAAAG
jgi:AcrR family transcriptional regulator